MIVRRMIVALAVTAGMIGAFGGQASAWRDGGPTSADFTNGSEVDVAGYTAALIAFETAPVVARGATASVKVNGCASGSALAAVLVGHPSSQVTGTSSGNGSTLALVPPVAAETGFNIIRVTCTPTGGSSKSTDVTVDVPDAGAPGVVSTVTASFGSSGGGGGLPSTGSDVRSWIGLGTAAVLLGGALAVGTRRRFASTVR